MPNWTESMKQTFEYYTVDPNTWKDVKKLDFVKSSTINRNTDSETLGSASFDVDETIGECYLRAYLVTIQNGVTERHPLGTFLVQTPRYSYDGKVKSYSMDAYTPLLELKEKPVPIGYYVPKGENIMDFAYMLCRSNMRGPVVKTTNSRKMHEDFVADTSDNYLTYVIDLIANAKYILTLDEMGRVLFSPKQDMASLSPVWTYDDGNSSILYPDFTIDNDLYGIPNVVEVIYSNGTDYYYERVVNDDPNSPVSTVNRGREITHRVTDPSVIGDPTEDQIKEYARNLLKEVSTLEYTIAYSHGYCPVRVGDCVRLNYEKAGLYDVKAKVIEQSISCEPGCPVSEKAVFTKKLWG